MRTKYFNMGRLRDLNQLTIALSVAVILIAILVVAYFLEYHAEKYAFRVDDLSKTGLRTDIKEAYEVYKLAAEIRQIRSDTAGSLFWLKLVALFITVGGAVGGYLVGQSKLTRDRLASEDQWNQQRLKFEHRKDVDTAYQQIIQELSDKEAVLRAAAAVKLGSILQAIPVEWDITDRRREELILLTKQVLAAALAIEKDRKVLKTITIALVLHRPAGKGEVRNLDLSYANALDAYWAKVDFTYADFYRANLEHASFRSSILSNVQFREANLRSAVFINANCEGANFKLADLRNADFSAANLAGSNFEEAKVFGLKLKGAGITDQPGIQVDISPDDNNVVLISFDEWLQRLI